MMMKMKGRHSRVNRLRTAALLLPAVFIGPGAFGSPACDFTVAKDGSGNFRTIQEAVTACRDFAERDYHILVKKVVYEENLVIPSWKRRITIAGENRDSTIITWSDYSGRTDRNGNTLNTFTSCTCLIAGNDIVVENLTFVNASGRVGQAVALHVEGDRCIFRNCRLIGDQDMLFASGEQSRQYFVVRVQTPRPGFPGRAG
jgi:pectinesterase